jgi:hypothetical protein
MCDEIGAILRRRENQRNETRHNDTRYNDARYNDTRYQGDQIGRNFAIWPTF